MNTALLRPEVQAFIEAQLSTDLAKLLFKGSPFEDISIQELVIQIQSKAKAKEKLPTWFATSGVYYPPKLHIEQTSSELTAAYKAQQFTGKKLVDTTGGFGVDSYFFAKQFESVTHCETNEALSQMVQHNAQALGLENLEVLATDGIAYLNHSTDPIDLIFVDPSRRDALQQRVFMLDDCTPNVVDHMPLYLSKAQKVMLKLSPMLDIHLALQQLPSVDEIHIVAVHNDVKELLFLLSSEPVSQPMMYCSNITKKETETFQFPYPSSLTSSLYGPPESYLYEPNAAIMKSGGFHEVSAQFGLKKLHPHSHLYTHTDLLAFPGRRFEIREVFPYDKKLLKKKFSKANITVRNFPKSVAEIRKETQIKDGGSNYLFATTLSDQRPVVICCHQL